MSVPTRRSVRLLPRRMLQPRDARTIHEQREVRLEVRVERKCAPPPPLHIGLLCRRIDCATRTACCPSVAGPARRLLCGAWRVVPVRRSCSELYGIGERAQRRTHAPFLPPATALTVTVLLREAQAGRAILDDLSDIILQ